MYIIVSKNPEAPVLISRKLHKALNLKTSEKIYGAISISQIKGTDKFAIIRRSPEETFEQQCSLITAHPKRDRRTPSVFNWTVPSLEYIKAVSKITITSTKVIKVVPKILPSGVTIYILQT